MNLSPNIVPPSFNVSEVTRVKWQRPYARVERQTPQLVSQADNRLDGLGENTFWLCYVWTDRSGTAILTVRVFGAAPFAHDDLEHGDTS